jgi:hypothetical protein
MPVIKTKLLIAFLLAFSIGCGGPPSSSSDSGDPSAGPIPELTDEVIRERINESWMREVPPDIDGMKAANVISNTDPTPEPISWGFGREEPKEITVVDKQMNGTRATIVLDIKTASGPRSRNRFELAGRIRTEWQLRTGWVLRKWEITDIENISMKYKRFPKLPADNSNTAPSR